MEKNNIECCEKIEVHEELLKIVQEKMPDEVKLYDLAELFKIFGDSTRIRILFVLFEAEVCVCDLAQVLNMKQSAISHQLRILKQNKLVKSRREGKSARSRRCRIRRPTGRYPRWAPSSRGGKRGSIRRPARCLPCRRRGCAAFHGGIRSSSRGGPSG